MLNLKMIQHNCCRGGDILHAALETGLRLKTDIVLVQEPPVERRYRHPGYQFFWPETNGRTLTARRIDSPWSLELNTRATREAKGDVQVLQARHNKSKTVIKIVNVYSQAVFMPDKGQSKERPAHNAAWEDIVTDQTIICGDFNAHSPIWNPYCRVSRDATFLEELIEAFGLRIWNDGAATYHTTRSDQHSIIDLTMTTPDLNVGKWRVVVEDEHTTGSDHELIEFTLGCENRGSLAGEIQNFCNSWAISDITEDEDKREAAQKSWKNLSEYRAKLNDFSTEQDLESEAEWIQESMFEVLNKHARKLRLCARSKRWWNDEIQEKRKCLGRAKRKAKHNSDQDNSTVKRCRQELRKAIRTAKSESWEKFLESAEGSEVWTVLRYTKPNKGAVVIPELKKDNGEIACTHEEKSQLLAKIAFPSPIFYAGDEGVVGPPGTAFESVTDTLIQECLSTQSSKKAPGLDGLGVPAIKLLWDWDASRVLALVRTAIRLGTHPRIWKVAKAVVIPKPDKTDYSLARSYRVISLLNCLGKLVEKVAANLISSYLEKNGLLHQGQFGCRRGRSAVDAVGILIAKVQEAWSQGKIAAALMMDVKAAFPSVSKDCLCRKMRAMQVDENLVRWTQSFMQDRRAKMAFNGRIGEEIEVTTGLPQGSAVSPILFAIYISDIHSVVEGRVKGIKALSFVDDVTWLAIGKDIGEVVEKLERCAAVSQEWAQQNAVEFESEKSEAVLFSKLRRHSSARQKMGINVGHTKVQFAKEATRWLGTWLDSRLNFSVNRKKRVAKAKSAESGLRRVLHRHGVSPGSARQLQMAVIQATLLYAAEITWSGTETEAKEYQNILNKMARRTLGALPSTPLGPLMAESHITPAKCLLDSRQGRYALRLLRSPLRSQDVDRVLYGGSELASRLRQAVGLQIRDRDHVEPVAPQKGLVFQGEISILEAKRAERIAKKWEELGDTTLWTDGSRLDDGRVGFAVVWAQGTADDLTWEGVGESLGDNKEVFDAEVYALARAAQILANRNETGHQYSIFCDSQTALQRCQDDRPGPGQAFAITFLKWAEKLYESGNTLCLRWVPGHKDIEGNEVADVWAKSAASSGAIYQPVFRRHKPQNVRNTISLAHIARKISERRSAARNKWIADKGVSGSRYITRRKTGMRTVLKSTKKHIAARYFQLLTGHAIIAPYLKNKLDKVQTERCWWCNAKRQTRDHLFKECKRWKPQIRVLWKSVSKATNGRVNRLKSIAKLFSADEATEPILEFLRDTDVGTSIGLPEEWAVQPAIKDLPVATQPILRVRPVITADCKRRGPRTGEHSLQDESTVEGFDLDPRYIRSILGKRGGKSRRKERADE
jgi:ribonuclease HI